jgi:hypothetical protein
VRVADLPSTSAPQQRNNPSWRSWAFRPLCPALVVCAAMKSQPGSPMTLGNAAAARVRLIVWCKDCRHQIEPDPAEMAQRYGATAPKLLCPIGESGGSLTHDDRVDAVAGAVAHFQRAMMMDVDQAAKAMRDEEMQAEIEDFLEGFNQPTYRGMRVNGVRVATWSSQHGWSGDSRPDAEWLQ